MPQEVDSLSVYRMVWGFVSPLSVSFPTRRYVHVAVNGRVVDTDSFAPAVSKAYSGTHKHRSSDS